VFSRPNSNGSDYHTRQEGAGFQDSHRKLGAKQHLPFYNSQQHMRFVGKRIQQQAHTQADKAAADSHRCKEDKGRRIGTEKKFRKGSIASSIGRGSEMYERSI
jgi:hypothetical protein